LYEIFVVTAKNRRIAFSCQQMLDTDTNQHSVSTPGIQDFEMVIGRAYSEESEPWESNTRSASCGLGENSRPSSGGNGSGNAPEDPVLPEIHALLTGPELSLTAYGVYLWNRYGHRSLSPPGAASQTHKNGCLLARQNANSCEFLLLL
jgi:hypothetical protein